MGVLAKPVRLEMYRLTLPMRAFEHAAASRESAPSWLVAVTWSDGKVGWGQALPREYVTGESMESVRRNLVEFLWPTCLDEGLLDVGPEPRMLPTTRDGAFIGAAAAALDVASARRILEGRQAPTLASHIGPRVSGALGSRDAKRTAWRLRMMWLFGLRDYKLKLGLGAEQDDANLRVVRKIIGRQIDSGRASLRVDYNGAWDGQIETIQRLAADGVCCVEQPVFASPGELLELAMRLPLPVMADESLLRRSDAEIFLGEPKRIWWNVRIGKNGGLLPALDLLRMADERGVTVSLGCMVGETSILSAAQRRLLQMSPPVRFVEGNYGRFLLKGDIVPRRKSLRFGYGGSLSPPTGRGLGVHVDPASIAPHGELIETLEA